MADKRIDYETAKKKERKFVRPSEGAAKYSMGITKFTQLAKEANGKLQSILSGICQGCRCPSRHP